MNPTKRTSIHIRRADEEIFLKISKLDFGNGIGVFVSDMMNKYGQEYIDAKVKSQVEKLEKLTKV